MILKRSCVIGCIAMLNAGCSTPLPQTPEFVIPTDPYRVVSSLYQQDLTKSMRRSEQQLSVYPITTGIIVADQKRKARRYALSPEQTQQAMVQASALIQTRSCFNISLCAKTPAFASTHNWTIQVVQHEQTLQATFVDFATTKEHQLIPIFTNALPGGKDNPKHLYYQAGIACTAQGQKLDYQQPFQMILHQHGTAQSKDVILAWERVNINEN